jgi:hypothetical protein
MSENQTPSAISSADAPAALGAELRRQREERGLSLGEVSERLKLPARQVEALENGHYGDMPEPVFVRGFLRSYGRFLDLDETVLNSYLAHIVPPESIERSRPQQHAADSMVNQELKKPFPTWIFGLLAAALLGVGIYYWQGKSQSEHLRQEAGAGSAVQSGGSQAASEVPLANGNMVVKPMEEPQAASGTASAPAAAGGELVINTRYRTMLTVSNAKGEILINQIVPARSEHRFKDGAPYEVRLGYAIGSTASYGGENIDIDSKRKGKTAVFTVGSTVQAASAPQ